MSDENPAKLKWSQLTVRIIANTERGKLDWSSGPSENCVVTSVGNFVISLFDLGSTDFLVQISDESGNVIDSFRDTELDSFMFGTSPHVALGNLFRIVKRQISGAELALDKILAALPDPDEIPF